MKEPISTVTNVAYLIAAIGIADVIATPVLIALGIMSGWYHTTKTTIAQTWDMRMVYMTLMAGILTPFGERLIVTVPPLIMGSGLLWFAEPRIGSTYLVPVIFAIVIIAAYSQGASLWFVPVFAVAGVLNLLDLRGVYTGLTADLLHSGWHLCTAAGFWMVFVI